MVVLQSAAESTALPMETVGWAVTVLGLLLVVAWTAYLYR